MVRHVILWTLKKEYSSQQREELKKSIKVGIETLNGKIPGLLGIKVYINPFETSNAELMLDASFDSKAALDAYDVHPIHVAVANTFFFPFMDKFSIMDFEV